MQRKFDKFLEHLDACVDESGFEKALRSMMLGFDLGYFAYLSVPRYRGDSPRLISNYPVRWTSHYLERQYEKLDPVIGRARCDECPFQWRADHCNASTTSPVKQFFDEAEQFGICCGLTIPIADKNNFVTAVTLAADTSVPCFFRAAEKHLMALQLVATCFHNKARRMLAADRHVDGVALTKREFECLRWAAQGKSAWEIGQILSITRRTAAFHLDNARHKLDVRTIAQAVARLASAHPSFR